MDIADGKPNANFAPGVLFRDLDTWAGRLRDVPVRLLPQELMHAFFLFYSSFFF